MKIRILTLFKALFTLSFLFLACILYNDILHVKTVTNNSKYIVASYKVKGSKINYPSFKDKKIDKKIKSYTEEFKNLGSDITFDANIIDNKYLSVLFYLPNNDYKSYLLDLETVKDVGNDVLIKDDKVFKEQIDINLSRKYPKFIKDGIFNGEGNISYLFQNNEVIMYFKNFTITPAVSDNISIKVNYNEIKDILNFKYNLDMEYISETFVLDKNKKTVAFTFDDGPRKTTTSRLVTILADNHANATFFMLGNKLSVNVQTVKLVVANGNEVGSHSFSHPYLTRINNTKLATELNRPFEIFNELTNRNLTLLRPPYGSITDKIKSQVTVPIVLWNLDTLDWKYRDAKKIVEKVLTEINDGDIIIMHDIHSTTIDAVELLLPELYSLGYQVTTVSKLAELKGITLEPGKVYRHLN